MSLGLDMSMYDSVHHFGPDWNIRMTTGVIFIDILQFWATLTFHNIIAKLCTIVQYFSHDSDNKSTGGPVVLSQISFCRRQWLLHEDQTF